MDSKREIKPIARKLRREDRTLESLHAEAVKEGKDWSFPLFKSVTNGWHRHEGIEAWLRVKGFGEELDEARALTRQFKMKKLREEEAEYGNE